MTLHDMHVDAGVPMPRRPDTTPEPGDLLIGTNQLLVEILAELKHLRNAMAAASRSHVEMGDTAKSASIPVSVKVYAESPPLDDAIVECVAAFRTLKAEVERGQMEAWKQTVEDLQR